MAKLYVGIIFGGISSEHDISLQSAKNIACVIDRDRFEVIMIRIDKDGVWYKDNMSDRIMFLSYLNSIIFDVYQYLKYRCIKKILRYRQYTPIGFNNICYCDILSRIDVVFPIIHGRLGEDGALQGVLKMRKIPFVGTGILGSALSMDKDVAKCLLRASGLMVAPFITLTNLSDVLDMNFEYCADVLGLPLFVKPANQGSSIGVSKVIDSRNFYQAINLAFSLDRKVLIESAVIGRELECAVLGNKHPEVSVCGEIVLDHSFYTYQKKYLCQDGVKIVIPAKIATDINEEIRSVVLRAFHVLQCYGMARVDLFLTSDDRIIINEVNTLPGFTTTSMYPKLWEASGLSCKDLISILIELALEIHQIDE